MFKLHITKTRLFKYIENFTSKILNFFQIKNSVIFHISTQNIDCGYSLEPPRRGGSNEYPQSMFWAEIRKIMYTPVNPGLLYKSGVQGGQNYIGMFSWWITFLFAGRFWSNMYQTFWSGKFYPDRPTFLFLFKSITVQYRFNAEPVHAYYLFI